MSERDQYLDWKQAANREEKWLEEENCKCEEGAEDRKVPILSISKEKTTVEKEGLPAQQCGKGGRKQIRCKNGPLSLFQDIAE